MNANITLNKGIYMNNKLHFGLLCNDVKSVFENDDAYCVECSDGLIDICEDCFSAASKVESQTPNPFENPQSEYWFNGSMKELKLHLDEIKQKCEKKQLINACLAASRMV